MTIKQKEKVDKKVSKAFRETRKHLGYTEKLVRNVLMMCWVALLLAILYTFQYQSSEVWEPILDVVKYLSVSTIGFFVWKARGENLIKIRNNPDFEME